MQTINIPQGWRFRLQIFDKIIIDIMILKEAHQKTLLWGLLIEIIKYYSDAKDPSRHLQSIAHGFSIWHFFNFVIAKLSEVCFLHFGHIKLFGKQSSPVGMYLNMYLFYTHKDALTNVYMDWIAEHVCIREGSLKKASLQEWSRKVGIGMCVPM